MRKEIKDYSIWKIQYCAIFEGHDYDCIPIFQVLVPNMTMEPNDIVTLKWTILKEINYSQTTGYSDLSFLYILDLVNKKKISLDNKK